MSLRDAAASVPFIARSLITLAVITATSNASPFSMRVLSAIELSNFSVSFWPVVFSNCGPSSSTSALVALELRTVSDWAAAFDATSQGENRDERA